MCFAPLAAAQQLAIPRLEVGSQISEVRNEETRGKKKGFCPLQTVPLVMEARG